MNINNQKDKDLVDSLCPAELEMFIAWFDKLNEANKGRNNTFYNGTRLEDTTGVLYWFDYFVEGSTPTEALEQDLLNN